MTEPHGERRKKLLALILSGIFPGLGQLYNRQPIRAAAFIIAGIVLTWLTGRAVPTNPIALMETPLSFGALVLLSLLMAVWIWSVIDAWRAAGR